jgi:hypothetical protein
LHWQSSTGINDNTFTSERLKAQGKSIKRAVLTGSLLRRCWTKPLRGKKVQLRGILECSLTPSFPGDIRPRIYEAT